MRWEKIVERYKDEWVLIDVKVTDDDFTVKEGNVIAHSKDKDRIYKKLLELKPKKFSIEYTGQIPEDLAFMFNQCSSQMKYALDDTSYSYPQ